LSNGAHDRLHEGHFGSNAAASHQLLFQAAEGGVLRAAGFAAPEVCLALAGLFGFEQSFQAGDQVFPAFGAVHNCYV
jgi:hypothetical protein